MDIRKKMSDAAVRGLYPIVRMLLSFGVTESEFARLARTVFVKVAAEIIEEGPIVAGKRATAQRIAVMTGVPRHAIKPILDDKNVIPQDEWYRNLCATVLTDWHNQKGYYDIRGNPVPIPFSGPAPSFEALVNADGKKGRADISPHAVLDELKLVGAVEEVPVDKDDPEGETRLLAKQSIFRRVGSNIEDLEAAMDDLHNMMSTKYELMRNENALLYAGDVLSLDADKKTSHILLRNLVKSAQTWLGSQKTKIDTKKADSNDESAETRRVGVGVYVYADDKMRESKYFSSLLLDEEEQKAANE